MTNRITTTLAALTIATCAAAVTASAANAAVYLDRASFNAVLGAHSFIDFENLVGTPGYPDNYGNNGHRGVGGITVGSLHFNNNENTAFILGPQHGSYNMGSYNLLGGYKQTTINIAGGVTAFGFDVGQPAGWGTGPLSYTIEVRPISGVLTQVASPIGAQGPNFFGYTGPAFDQVKVTGGFGYYVYLDDVAYGDVRAVGPGVPEPATWAMLIAGFGLVGAAARRRRTLTVSA